MARTPLPARSLWSASPVNAKQSKGRRRSSDPRSPRNDCLSRREPFGCFDSVAPSRSVKSAIFVVRVEGAHRSSSFEDLGRRRRLPTRSSKSWHGKPFGCWTCDSSRTLVSRNGMPGAFRPPPSCRRRMRPSVTHLPRGGGGIFPGHPSERRVGSTALTSHRWRARSTGRGRSQGRRANGRATTRQRRCPDRCLPSDRSRAATDAIVRAIHARARRSDPAQPDRRHGARHHRCMDQHRHHAVALRAGRPNASGAAAARIAGCRRGSEAGRWRSPNCRRRS